MAPQHVPLVGIPVCVRQLGHHPFHIAGDKYIRAVSDGAEAIPLVIPALGHTLDPECLVARLDGLLITGSPSNVEPKHYGGPASTPGTLHDLERDATTLPLIQAALKAGVPVLAICRGIQELNVALGGSLHQRVQELPGKLDHRADDSRPVGEQYAKVHSVSLTPGGLLERITGKREIRVNSIHAQAIDRLADGLTIEAVAPDGLIEAVSVTGAPAFALAVQWHPEWRFWECPDSMALFQAFGRACTDYAAAGPKNR